MGPMTRILWTFSTAPDVSYYQIRWSPDFSTTDWNKMQILIDGITNLTNTASVHSRSGVYAIRAVDKAGNWSEVNYARTFIEDIAVIPPSYLIEAPPWTGNFVNCELNGDGDLVLSIDPLTGMYYPEGFLYFDDNLLLERVWKIRMHTTVVMESYPETAPDTNFHDAQVIVSTLKDLPKLEDPWFSPLETADPLAGDPSNYGAWSPIVAEWMDARLIRSGVWLRSFNGTTTPVVKSIKSEIFFDERNEHGEDVLAAGGTLNVDFQFPFFETPGIQLTLNDGGGGR